MRNPLLVALSLLSLACSAVAQVQETGPRNLDIIKLKNGETFEGRLLTELDEYVEFEIEGGSVVGVGKAQVLEILRGAGAAIAPVHAMLEPRDEWFVLHDAEGDSVGWLHATVVVRKDGGITASEEFEFTQGRRRYQVTSQCSADAELRPLGCYFRERISEPMLAISAAPGGFTAHHPDRIKDERIIDARCSGDQLIVIKADGTGRRERSYEWADNATFPLLARTTARSNGQAIDSVPMFDPATEEIVVRSIAGMRRRAVTLGGKNVQVQEIVESGTNTENSVWIDASMHTVRREIAGPALVAVPSTARTAKSQVGHATIPPALAREVEGAFGLWVPNPAWRVEEQLDPGQLAMTCEAHGATIGLSRIDHLEPGTPVVMAAEAVANWFRLLHPDLRMQKQETVMVRGRRAVRLIAESRTAMRAERATVDVIPHDGNFLVLVCRAPRRAWNELESDFAFVLRTAELEPESVAPTLKGPLRSQRDKRQAQPKPDAGSGSKPRANRPLPTVKIPG